MLLIALACLLPLTSAFDVSFYDKLRCEGDPTGDFTGSTTTQEKNKCQNAFDGKDGRSVKAPGGAFNVRILDEGADVQSGVAFFGIENCELLIGFGNVPSCIGAGAYKSFKVITLDEADDQLQQYGDGPPSIPVTPTNATDKMEAYQNLPDHSKQRRSIQQKRAAKANSKPKRNPNAMAEKKLKERSAIPGYVSHGDTMLHGRTLYKYHQVSKRAFRGVPVENWNEDLHKRNDAIVWEDSVEKRDAPGRLHTRDLSSSSSPNPLEPRKILNDKCYLVRSCMIKNSESENLPIKWAGDDLLTAIESHSPDGNDWDALHKTPFIVELTNKNDEIQGYIFAMTDRQVSDDDLKTCSDGNSLRAVLKDGLADGVDGSLITDLKVDLNLGADGRAGTNSLIVSTRSAGAKTKDFKPICFWVEVKIGG